MIEKILNHKGFKRIPIGSGKKGGICPRCGGRRYDFYCRYKRCDDCHYNTYAERILKTVKYDLRRGRDVLLELLEVAWDYIDNLKEVK